MKRRQLLKATSAGIAALAAPRVRAAGTRGLVFTPGSNLAVLDPVWTSARITRNHGYMVFDTLYGVDERFVARPQMAAGHLVEDDGRRWTITLRDGLLFHDGEPVRSSDVVASIRRWAVREGFGQALLDATDELAAVSDKVLRFRLKKPFPHLADALAGTTATMPCIMPERLARTDPFKRVAEVIGSGPYQFAQNDYVSGSRAVYQRFAGYVPRDSGKTSYLSGPKHVHFDRVEWRIIPDAATTVAALQTGEIDWWDYAITDLLPLLEQSPAIRTAANEPPIVGLLRFNQLYPPFDNVEIRRALLGAIDQAEAMRAVAGTDRRYWRDGVGLFPREMPLANDAGIEVLTSPRDMAHVAQMLEDAGYRHEPVVVLAPADVPIIHALSEVGIDELRRAGMTLDIQSLDLGTILGRRANKAPPNKGGWNLFFTFIDGTYIFQPAGNMAIRGNGGSAWDGWPFSPRLEELRSAWLDAANFARERQIARELQLQMWRDVPYIPMGEYILTTAFRADLVDIPKGFPLFYGVRRG